MGRSIRIVGYSSLLTDRFAPTGVESARARHIKWLNAYPSLAFDGPTNYQAGDLAGLARIASYDCFP
jgi:hypothetical protein